MQASNEDLASPGMPSTPGRVGTTGFAAVTARAMLASLGVSTHTLHALMALDREKGENPLSYGDNCSAMGFAAAAAKV